jgi:parvulin-like peptidyl-prolyl isomerase
MRHWAAFMAAAVLLFTPGILRAKTAGASAQSTATAPAGQREQYQKLVEAKLRKLDREIAKLNAQAPQKGQKLQQRFRQQMAEVDEKRKAAQRDLEKFENTSQQAWQDAKPDLDAAMKDLETAYKRAASHFK